MTTSDRQLLATCSKGRPVVFLLATALLMAGCQSTSNGPTALTTPTATLTPASCHTGTDSGQPLPDPRCTPGALNPAVTQATIGVTICKSGWTATIRPPVSYTDRLKRQQMPAYGEHGQASSVEEDHDVPLAAGGNPTSPANLWPMPIGPAKVKDAVELAAQKAVCAGRMSLATVQAGFEHDWVILGRELGVTIP